jgi:hypothetical protein
MSEDQLRRIRLLVDGLLDEAEICLAELRIRLHEVSEELAGRGQE